MRVSLIKAIIQVKKLFANTFFATKTQRHKVFICGLTLVRGIFLELGKNGFFFGKVIAFHGLVGIILHRVYILCRMSYLVGF